MKPKPTSEKRTSNRKHKAQHRDVTVCKIEVSPVAWSSLWFGETMMTVLHMSQKELTRLDTLQRVERGDLHADDAALLLGVIRRSQPTHMFPDHTGEAPAKVDRLSLGLQRLK